MTTPRFRRVFPETEKPQLYLITPGSGRSLVRTMYHYRLLLVGDRYKGVDEAHEIYISKET